MEKKPVAGFCFMLSVSVMFTTQIITVTEAGRTIYIRPDGSIDPPTAPISRVGDIYTLTDNTKITGFAKLHLSYHSFYFR